MIWYIRLYKVKMCPFPSNAHDGFITGHLVHSFLFTVSCFLNRIHSDRTVSRVMPTCRLSFIGQRTGRWGTGMGRRVILESEPGAFPSCGLMAHRLVPGFHLRGWMSHTIRLRCCTSPGEVQGNQAGYAVFHCSVCVCVCVCVCVIGH